LHRALEISVDSSLSQRTRPHVHGVERNGSRFWASGNDSESESEVAMEEQADLPDVSVLDGQFSLGFNNVQSKSKMGKTVRRLVEQPHALMIRPWEGPLLAPSL
jgi:hypothetical protein